MEIKIELIRKKLLNAATEKEREVLFRELAEQKEELDQIVADRTAGAMVRSRAVWAEAGEKNTKYFLRLENRHAGKKAISRLVNDQNQTIADQKEILKEISDFHRNLYMQPLRKFDKQAMIDELKKIDLPLVDGAQKTNCDRAISENECLIALRSFSKNKSPGLDGLTPEFYLCFWGA